VKQIFSPYRICPLGAHVDHQGGVALGRTIRLAGSLTGSDKLGHFFSQGLKYYRSHLEGWSEELGDARSFADLPATARTYVARLHELVGVPIPMVSVGPAREQSLAAA